LRIKHLLDDALGVAFTLETMAGIAAAAGPPERAALLLGAADQARKQIGLRAFGSTRFMRWREEYVATIRAALSPAEYDQAFRHGTELTLNQAVAFALEEAAEAVRPDTEAGRIPGHAPLTRREWQVATLVAQGLSNKQIADELVISRRTAETHVERILTKLGFSSRAQVVLWVARQPP